MRKPTGHGWSTASWKHVCSSNLKVRKYWKYLTSHEESQTVLIFPNFQQKLIFFNKILLAVILNHSGDSRWMLIKIQNSFLFAPLSCLKSSCIRLSRPLSGHSSIRYCFGEAPIETIFQNFHCHADWIRKYKTLFETKASNGYYECFYGSSWTGFPLPLSAV